MGRIFVFIGGLLVLLLTAALVVPPFVDWSGYRAEFEREAGHILGRPVEVLGDVRVQLLPFPSLQFSNVRVGADTAHPAMSVDAFSMDAELMPFLRGQLLIYDMRVERPRVNILIDKDGMVDWAIRPSTPIDPAQIKVERLSINDGSVTIHDEASGRIYSAEAVDAVLSATRLSGPWQANGTANLAGTPIALGITSGELKPDGSLRFRIRLSPENIPATLETDGDMRLDNGRLHYSGDFSLRSADLLDNKQQPVSEKPFFSDVRVTGKFSADKDKFDASEFRMEQGPTDNPYVVNGKALIDFGDNPHFQISADGQQIYWGPAENLNAELAAASEPFSDRLVFVQKMLEQLPIPDMPGSVDLRLPAIVAGGTTMREVTIHAEPDGNGWSIRQFAADLPGRTKIEAKGRLVVGQEFGFVGDMLVASRQPSGLASWLNESVDEPIRKLAGAGFSGKVDFRKGLQRIDDLEIGLGQSTLTGQFLRQVTGDAEPAITLQLEGDEIESDALQALLGFFLGEQGVSYLEGQSLALNFKSGPVHYEDIVAGEVDLAVRLNNGRFDFDRLMISDVAGVTLTATGTYEPFAAIPSATLDATLLSNDLQPFITMMAHRHPEVPVFRSLAVRADNYRGLFEDSEINIIARGEAPPRHDLEPPVSAENKEGKSTRVDASHKASRMGDEFSFSLSGKTGTMKLDLAGTASGAFDDSNPMQMQLNATAASKNGEEVLALLGLPALPLGIAGELSADVTMQGAPSAGMRTQLKLTASDGTAVADGILSLVGGDAAASGKAQIQALDLQPFIATMGYVLPGFGEGLSADISSDFQYAKGLLRLPNFGGKLGGDDVNARIEANFSDSGLPQIKGETTLDSLKMSSVLAIMLGQDSFNEMRTDSNQIWSTTPFATRPSLPVLINMKLNVADVDMGGFGTISGFSTQLNKNIDSLSLNEMTGNWAGGYLIGNISLQNRDSAALVNSEFKWKGAELANIYQPSTGNAPLTGVIKSTVSLNGAGKNVAELMASLTGSGSVDVENLVVKGLDQNAFDAMLTAADQLGDRIDGASSLDAAHFAEIAQNASGKGEFSAGAANFDFNIVGGVVRVMPFDLDGTKAALAGELQLDIPHLAVNGSGSFTYKDDERSSAGKNEGIQPFINYTLMGSINEPRIEINQEPLVQFLTQSALEREQERVEAMQANIMEKQHLRRQVELLQAEIAERERGIKEDEKRRRSAAKARNDAAHPTKNEQLGESIGDFIRNLEEQQQLSPSIEP
ncbi:AsmA family protein [Falsochrobactrum ovis]|uniref:AsmA-like protein n=1 Tax=Falsochrobactrum ovis TaxID=1293442 RepID=A0A364JXM8_9HYPH|nr:AsmA family protein [Falsochrobactrum ovis]RAK32159.1 AsmA-like protein [Falsochrobactrum ovis]